MSDLDKAVDELADGMYINPLATPVHAEFDMKGIFALLREKRRRGEDESITPEEAERFRRLHPRQ